MDDIKNISIVINDDIFVNIVPSTLKIYVGSEEREIGIKVIYKLLDIISKWDHSYIDNSIIDGSTCSVKIFTDSGVNEYYMKGSFPKTYREFYEIVRGFYE